MQNASGSGSPCEHIGAKWFRARALSDVQGTDCMARTSWCFCCSSWWLARKEACSRFLCLRPMRFHPILKSLEGHQGKLKDWPP